MKYKKQNFPRAMLKSLVEDINNLVGSNEGKLLVLELMEEIPAEIKTQVLESLSSFYSPRMACFFNLLIAEYGKEFESIANRALTKYSLAGLNIDDSPPVNNHFYKAYASASRHTGRMTWILPGVQGPKVYMWNVFFLPWF